MDWPGDLSNAKRTARDGTLGAFFFWLVGLSATTGLEANDIDERQLRRIRAKQIDAVTRLVPVTMTIMSTPMTMRMMSTIMPITVMRMTKARRLTRARRWRR